MKQMYKDAMIRFHRISKTHPVFSKYLKADVHDDDYENQPRFS